MLSRRAPQLQLTRKDVFVAIFLLVDVFFAFAAAKLADAFYIFTEELQTLQKIGSFSELTWVILVVHKRCS
jgi:hypothetical protein